MKLRCPFALILLVVALGAAAAALIWCRPWCPGCARLPQARNTSTSSTSETTTTTKTTTSISSTTGTSTTTRADGPRIGWKPSAVRAGVGEWCEAVVPEPDWTLDACGEDPLTLLVKVLTYNLFWWNLFGVNKGGGGISGKLIESNSHPLPFDFMGFQECENVSWVLWDASLQSSHSFISGQRALAIAYRSVSWRLLASGETSVGEDRKDQWYGKRDVMWGRFRHRDTMKTVFFANYHGTLPVNSGGLCGGTATACNILAEIASNAHQHDAVILVGDFNADSTCADVQEVSSRLHMAFTGTSFGGVDHIFSSCGTKSVQATKNLGPGGSDHDALSALLEI